MTKQKSTIQNKSFEFALAIIELYKQLIRQNEYVLSKQLLRSGTNIGANVGEASAGQSKKDFIAKMSIASKEAPYRLRLIGESKISDVNCDDCLKKCKDIINILTAIVKTSQQN